MVAFQGQLRERKDATFQPAYEPDRIATGDNGGKARIFSPEPSKIAL